MNPAAILALLQTILSLAPEIVKAIEAILKPEKKPSKNTPPLPPEVRDVLEKVVAVHSSSEKQKVTKSTI